MADSSLAATGTPAAALRVMPESAATVPGSTLTVTVRYFAAARAAAGVAEEQLTVPAVLLVAGDSAEPIGSDGAARGSEVAIVLAAATERHGSEMARVLLRCSFLLDEIAVHGTATPVRDGQTLDVLPPFAGG